MDNRGSLFLGLLMLIIIMSIVALRLLPEANTINQRNIEQEFSITLTEIRSAMDLERSLGNSSPCKAEYDALILDPSNPVKVKNYLDALAKNHFLLHSSPKDPTIPFYRWGTGANKLFWQAHRNLVSSQTVYGVGSFESGTKNTDGFDSPVGWVNSFPNHDDATFSYDTPSSADSSRDEYIGQNRFGTPYSVRGHCLRIASSTN